MRIFKDLCKWKISLFSAFSAVTGYILGTPQLEVDVVNLMVGVFLLACGSGALNQYQERDIDGLMERTKERPIPSNRIRPHHALRLSLILITMGLLFLFSLGNIIVPALGLFALIWYNGIYTYLKRFSAFAIIPGALTGAIPPYMGWVTGDGALIAPKVLILCFLFFIWQVPHFWIILLNHGDDYERAGLPSINRYFTREQLLRITFIWILSVAVSCMLIPLVGTFSLIINYCLAATALWLCWSGVRLFKGKGDRSTYGLAFRHVNAYMLAVMFFIIVGGLL